MPLLLLTLLALFMACHARANPPEQPLTSHVVNGVAVIEWRAHIGHTYFVTTSDEADHLRLWTWAPLIEAGTGGDISYEFGGDTPKGFARLHYIDAVPPEGTSLEDWDADGDGLSNLVEITVHQTNPIKADTDGDGLPDGWEVANGLDPNDPSGVNGADGDPDGDFSTNFAEYQAGSHPQDGDDFPTVIWSLGNYLHAWSSKPAYTIHGHRVETPWTNNPLPVAPWEGSHITPSLLSDNLDGMPPFPVTLAEAFTIGAGCHAWPSLSAKSFASFTTSADSDNRSGDFHKRRCWVRSPAVDFQREFHFLKVTTLIREVLATASNIENEVVSVSVVTLTIPANATESESIDLSAEPPSEAGFGVTAEVALVPIEIQSHGPEGLKWVNVGELKIAKWQHAWTSNGTFRENFIDALAYHEPDRFQIRIPIGDLPEAYRKFYLSTTGAAEEEYNDDPTLIVLEKTHSGTEFVSKPMILVADEADNKFSNNNQVNDQTHIAALGSEVEFRIMDEEGPLVATLPVKSNGKIELRSLIVGPFNEGMLDKALEDIKVARRIYAQIGVEVFGTVEFVPVPAGVDLSDGLLLDTLPTLGTLGPEALALLNAYGMPDVDSRIIGIYVNVNITTATTFSGIARGMAFTQGWSNANNFKKTFLVSTKNDFNNAIFSHELGHALLDGQGGNQSNHFPEPGNLMRDYPRYKYIEEAASHQYDTKRLTEWQGNIILQSSSVK